MRYDEIYFLEVEHVEQAHADAIANGGGDPTVRDPGLIVSATMAPRQGYYSTFAEIAAAYVFGIAKNHGFVDGNKRTALAAMAYFLGMNSYPVNPGARWIGIVEGVANDSIDTVSLVAEIVALIGCDIPIDP